MDADGDAMCISSIDRANALADQVPLLHLLLILGYRWIGVGGLVEFPPQLVRQDRVYLSVARLHV